MLLLKLLYATAMFLVPFCDYHVAKMKTLAIVQQCKLWVLLLQLLLIVCASHVLGQLTPGFRPPSVPLMVVNPYFSVWSNGDNLYDTVPNHWTGSRMPFTGMISIDGKVYRYMSSEPEQVKGVMEQTSVLVYPTRTVYTFEEGGVRLSLQFVTPSFPHYTAFGALPVTILNYELSSIDGNEHKIRLYYDNSAEIAVYDLSEYVVCDRTDVTGKVTMRTGTRNQTYAGQGSDRIDWGYFYASTEKVADMETSISYCNDSRMAFVNGSSLPLDDLDIPRPCANNTPCLAVSWDLGIVKDAVIQRRMILAYDQVISIEYFGTFMAPLWRHTFKDSVADMLMFTHTKADEIIKYSKDFDTSIMVALNKVGGANYCTLASLVWRQAVGGTIYVWNHVTNEEWRFMKEISSDGDVSTVDVLYPASPLFMLVDPDGFFKLLKPILEYAVNNTAKYGLDVPYNLLWAPHHLGHWPICDLPPYKQEQMPMEETGNMLIMLAVIVQRNSSLLPKLSPYWDLLKMWTNYLVSTLPDPGNQLCTDDFEGPSPHNVNLAAKGILGLASYAYLLEMDGYQTEADEYFRLCKFFVAYWVAESDSGTHSRLQFNISNSWSMKYNLFYQKVLQLNIFPNSVFLKEESFYQKKMNKYGVPLDDRATFTKADWMMWVAAMGNETQFKLLVDALFTFANVTPDRTPFTDWYDTISARRVGFTARPVMGGLYAKLLVSI